ncbi:hypothetical protein VNO78_06424 [Psophocarpus tetragonolobus]|uniref:Uncharacterized protein n=1 Tax=Psophocarpus tetragonolobus TaxID=3891 RepID=A0AAN9ST71_PSOTE
MYKLRVNLQRFQRDGVQIGEQGHEDETGVNSKASDQLKAREGTKDGEHNKMKNVWQIKQNGGKRKIGGAMRRWKTKVRVGHDRKDLVKEVERMGHTVNST